MANLPISDAENNHDFSNDPLTDITDITFNTSGFTNVTFSAAQ